MDTTIETQMKKLEQITSIMRTTTYYDELKTVNGKVEITNSAIIIERQQKS